MDVLSLLMYAELFLMSFLYRSSVQKDKVYVLDDTLFLQCAARNSDMLLTGAGGTATHVLVRDGKGILPVNSCEGSMVNLATFMG